VAFLGTVALARYIHKRTGSQGRLGPGPKPMEGRTGPGEVADD